MLVVCSRDGWLQTEPRHRAALLRHLLEDASKEGTARGDLINFAVVEHEPPYYLNMDGSPTNRTPALAGGGIGR